MTQCDSGALLFMSMAPALLIFMSVAPAPELSFSMAPASSRMAGMVQLDQVIARSFAVPLLRKRSFLKCFECYFLWPLNYTSLYYSVQAG